MATNPYTSTFLLASIKRRGFVPTGQNTFTDANILAMADEAQLMFISPLLMRVREEHLIPSRTPYSISVSSGTANYDMPPRALAGRVRSVQILVGDSYEPLVRVEPEREHDYGASGGIAGYMLRGNQIVFVPEPSRAETVRVWPYQRPGRLVETSAVAQVSAISAGTKTITTVATIPSTFTTSETFDIIKGQPGFDCLAQDQTVTVASGTTLTFTNSLPSGLAVGDYVALAGETPIPQIPVELHPVLAQRTAQSILEAVAPAKATPAEQKADKAEARALSVLSPRVDGSSRVVINRYGPGWGARRGGR